MSDKKPLVNQPTKAPTRKMTAVIVAGVVVGALQGGFTAAFPDVDLGPVVSGIEPYIAPLVMVIAGYFRRERSA